MGNNQSAVNEQKTNKVVKFGSISNPDNPRPGYYFNPNTKTLIYKTIIIVLLPDETNFTKLNHGYAKTNKRVFYCGIPIESAKPENFTTINSCNLKEYPILKKMKQIIGVEYSGSTNSTGSTKIANAYSKGKLIKIT
jgi:hypothetical protein